HRFNEFQLTLKPLRERRSDIMFYAQYFLKIANKELNKNLEGFENEVIDQFNNYSWYGNLREMKNIIRRAALLSDENKIKSNCLPFELAGYTKNIIHDTIPIAASSEMIPDKIKETEKEEKPDLKSAALGAEYELILKVLKQAKFNKS